MRPGVSLGVLGYPGVSWGNQTDPAKNPSGLCVAVPDLIVAECRNLCT